MKRGISRADQNKRIRQEALREQLTHGGHLEHVIDIAKQLNDLDNELDSTQIQRLRAAADIKLGVIKKYLPDLKATEHTVDATIVAEVAQITPDEAKALKAAFDEQY